MLNFSEATPTVFIKLRDFRRVGGRIGPVGYHVEALRDEWRWQSGGNPARQASQGTVQLPFYGCRSEMTAHLSFLLEVVGQTCAIFSGWTWTYLVYYTWLELSRRVHMPVSRLVITSLFISCSLPSGEKEVDRIRFQCIIEMSGGGSPLLVV